MSSRMSSGNLPFLRMMKPSDYLDEKALNFNIYIYI